MNTPAVFGDYIDIYDISRAVEDGATVPIYYESRLARIELDEDEKPKIDAEIAELTEDEAASEQERLKRKWASVEALVGSEKRLALVAEDLVKHFEDRVGGARRQGDDRLHEPPHLRGALRRDREAAPGMAQRRRRGRRDQGGDDRRRVRSAGVAAAYRQAAQGAAGTARQARQGRRTTRSSW